MCWRAGTKSKIAYSLVIVVILVISSVCISILQQQQGLSKTSQLNAIYPLAPLAGSSQQSSSAQDGLANFSTRALITEYVVVNPGVYFREISEELDLPIGVVQYHVWNLVKDGQLEDYRSGRYRRFFGAGMYPKMEQTVISLLRQKTAGKILLLLSAGQPLSHMKLATTLGLSSQAVSWQMNRLKALAIVQVSFKLEGKSYQLIDDASRIVIFYGKYSNRL